jgi:hypothetical protein
MRETPFLTGGTVGTEGQTIKNQTDTATHGRGSFFDVGW